MEACIFVPSKMKGDQVILLSSHSHAKHAPYGSNKKKCERNTRNTTRRRGPHYRGCVLCIHQPWWFDFFWCWWDGQWVSFQLWTDDDSRWGKVWCEGEGLARCFSLSFRYFFFISKFLVWLLGSLFLVKSELRSVFLCFLSVFLDQPLKRTCWREPTKTWKVFLFICMGMFFLFQRGDPADLWSIQARDPSARLVTIKGPFQQRP